MVVVVESEFCTSSSLALAEGVGAATHTVNMMKSPNVDGILQVRQIFYPQKKGWSWEGKEVAGFVLFSQWLLKGYFRLG